MKVYIKSARVGKTKEVIVLQGNYGYGWDDLVEYETSDSVEAKREKRDYDENEVDVPHRLIRRRVPNPAYNQETVESSENVMASAWKAPNGKKYGKQTRRFPGKYLFTRKELRDMVDSGIAEDMAGTFDPMSMHYDIIGISWNETNGHRSGILIEDIDTGDLYVGNTYDANVAKL